MSFPDVPIAPGVPALPRQIGAAVDVLVFLTGDLFGFGDSAQNVWGIFLNGIQVIFPDTVLTLDFKQGYTIADAPQEQGAFVSYDKVNSPFDVKVRMATGGSEVARQEFIDNLDAIVGTLDLYDVVTPEKIYQSVNISHVSYGRAATRGLGIIEADIWLQEIRITAASQFSQTKTPSGAAPVNSGNVQPTAPTMAQVNDISFMQ